MDPRVPPFQTQPHPHEPPETPGVMRLWVDTPDLAADGDNTVMKCRAAADATGYVGRYYYVRQLGQHAGGDEVFVHSTSTVVCVYSGVPVNLVEISAAGGAGPFRAIIYSITDLGAGNYDIKLLVRNATPIDRAAVYDLANYFDPFGDPLPAVNDADSGNAIPLFGVGDYVWVWPEIQFDGDVLYRINQFSAGCVA